ncbi:MAG: hypothetical protein KF822_09190 [Steroidobacteraceae bacterium]|nr:hypothetical protein [Steroidobacteraceae bacterium]
MVETRMVEDPEFRNEVELTQALRQGLRELEKRGEIAPLLSPRRAFWSLPRVAWAASLATIALGAASFLFFSRPDPAAPGVVTESLQFAQTRGPGFEPDVTWRQPPAPQMVELRFDVGLEPAASYAVRIERAAGEDFAQVAVATAATSRDGEAVLISNADAFPPGDYRLTLTPLGSAGDQAPIRYRLRVIRY